VSLSIVALQIQPWADRLGAGKRRSASVGLENWDEIRTAYQVARMGTVSGAAEVLGVHHATVIRHIDALEKRLGSKLFQRHARGYTPTEAGRDLLLVAQTTEEQFGQLASRIKGQGETVAGELVVTAITGIEALLTPVFAEFQAQHPAVVIRFLTDMRLFRLDYGEAHVAIRAGGTPQEPDNVVQPLLRMRMGLYASRRYVEQHGLPSGPEDFRKHRFIGADSPESRAPFHRWLRENVPADCITYRVTESAATEAALRAGLGIGFHGVWEATGDPDLIEVMPPLTEWESPLWIVTHVDLHRTLKVQSFLAALKQAAAGWSCK
jgi:DNA-binding transcriptional LysR family regulator